MARAGGEYGIPVGRLCPQRAVQVQPELLEGLDQLVDDLVRTEKARSALRASPTMWAEKFFVRRLPGYTGAFVMPPHLRMPWIASVSFGYVCLLSFTRGDYKPTQPPNDG